MQSQNARKAALFNHLFNYLTMATIGTIVLMPKTPRGFFPCDGRKLKISGYRDLYLALLVRNVRFDEFHFWLPKLPDMLGFRHVICYDGLPSDGYYTTMEVHDDERIIGTMIPFFGEDYIPDGWALCDGKTHPETDNPQLASILGTHSVAGKAEQFYDMPNTGNKPYIICVKGKYPLY
jgi:microcystin-dependent protein